MTTAAPELQPTSPVLLRVPPEDEEHVRAGLEEADRGEGVLLTAEEVEHWASTGELPWETAESSI